MNSVVKVTIRLGEGATIGHLREGGDGLRWRNMDSPRDPEISVTLIDVTANMAHLSVSAAGHPDTMLTTKGEEEYAVPFDAEPPLAFVKAELVTGE